MSKGNGKSRYKDFMLPSSIEKVTLPSGMEAQLRPPGLRYFVRLGNLPGRLAKLAEGEVPDAPFPEDHLVTVSESSGSNSGSSTVSSPGDSNASPASGDTTQNTSDGSSLATGTAASPNPQPLTLAEAEDIERRTYLLLSEVFVSPRLVTDDAEVDEDHDIFHARALQPRDSTWVMEWATRHLKTLTRGGGADLSTFRPRTPASPGTGPGSETVG